jgi:putative endonuclease
LGFFYIMPHYLYILQSKKNGIYYKGSSSNPEERLKHHNTIEKGFTSRYRPWKIVYKKEYPTKAEAMQAERKVKGWKSRKMIQLLIEGKITP